MKDEDNKMDNKMTNIMRIGKNAVIGFAVGVMWELMIITPLMSDWTLRSTIVALVVSGCGCSVAGAVFAIGKNKKAENEESKVKVIG
jgi:uncharacterized membrane protein YadS